MYKVGSNLTVLFCLSTNFSETLDSKTSSETPAEVSSENYTCPSTWKEFTIDKRQRCLKYAGVNDIGLAAFICRAVQARVPLPENETQNREYLNIFLHEFTTMGRKSVGYIALALNDINKEQNFAKTTGDLAGWFNWYPGQPNGHLNENFVAMGTAGQPGKWHDFRETQKVDVFCEMAPIAARPKHSSAHPENAQLEVSHYNDYYD